MAFKAFKDLKCCKSCIVSMTCEESCENYDEESVKRWTEFNPSDRYDILNNLMDNGKLIDIASKADKCLLCGHCKIVYIDTGREMSVLGYCESCEVLYHNDLSQHFGEGLPPFSLLYDHYWNDEDEDDEGIGNFQKEVMTFKQANKVWNGMGCYN